MSADDSTKASQARMDERLRLLIRAREGTGSEGLVPFNRILLKFPLLRRTFQKIKSTFDEFDTDKNGTVDHDELTKALERLGARLSDREIDDVFNASDMYTDGRLTFKEFLVSLALGYLLGFIPVLTEGEDATLGSPAATSGSPPAHGTEAVGAIHAALHRIGSAELDASLLKDDGKALAYAFHLALDAFFQFDTERRGVLNKSELEESMSALALLSPGAGVKKSHSGGVHTAALTFLTDDRFKELDFDHDGNITFKEFVLAFFNWVGVDDDEDDDDDDDGGDEGGAEGWAGGGGGGGGGGEDDVEGDEGGADGDRRSEGWDDARSPIQEGEHFRLGSVPKEP